MPVYSANFKMDVNVINVKEDDIKMDLLEVGWAWIVLIWLR
jgi:hypothetical protein